MQIMGADYRISKSKAFSCVYLRTYSSSNLLFDSAQRLVTCTLRNELSADTLMVKMGGHMSKAATKLK